MTTGTISNSDSSLNSTVTYSDNPLTSKARDRLEEIAFEALETKENTLIEAGTSQGKSHLFATTQWRHLPEITGNAPVIHIHQTTEARDQAVRKSKSHAGVECRVLEGREDACPTAAGDYDDEIKAPNGKTPSEWFEWMCDVQKMKFGDAHTRLAQVCDLPCAEDGPCPSITQWFSDFEDEDGNPSVDVVHTTGNFAFVEDLIEDANLVFDERPEYSLTLDDRERQHLRDSVSHLLRYHSDGEFSVSDLESAATNEASQLEQQLRDLLKKGVSQEWFYSRDPTHRLAPEIGLAMLNAEEVFSQHWITEKDKEFAQRWMGEYGDVKVVIDGTDKLRHVHHMPDVSQARCVIGLDAFPSPYRWQLNTVADLRHRAVLTPEERRKWRREERELKIIQVGNATRSYTNDWDGAGKERSAGLIRALRQKHGQDFRTCISASEIENDVRKQMKAAGIEKPRTMVYGGQNSRNDFEDEPVGSLIGCNDPGDPLILDLLALAGKKAWPDFIEMEDGELKRKPGRQFLGPDANIARELLESVREANLAQAAGRYARNPRSPDSGALVYVWSDACPTSLRDDRIKPLYQDVTEKKEAIIECLREGHHTVRKINEETDTDKSYLHECLNSFHEQGWVGKSEGTGKYGATEWEWQGGEVKTIVHLGN